MNLENKSLFRTTVFTETNVMEFFHNYERALISWNILLAESINIDETGVSTVVQSANFVAQIGKYRLDKLSVVNEELCLP